jgi:hypothetical protein
MSTIKVTLMGFGILAALSNAVHALDLRFGNGSNWVTVEPSTDASIGPRQSSAGTQESPALKRQPPHSTSASRHRRRPRTTPVGAS